jgi:hypothetical protein
MYILTYSRFSKKIVAKVEILFFLFLVECNFSTLINYSTNMCWTSCEPTLSTHEKHLIKVWPILVMQHRKSTFFLFAHGFQLDNGVTSPWRIFTLVMNRTNTWAPKFTRKVDIVSIWSGQPSCTNCMFGDLQEVGFVEGKERGVIIQDPSILGGP